MEYKKWSDALSTIDADNKSNVIEKIKEELKEKDEGEYEEWERANFNVNYQFECEGCKFTLLHFAVRSGCKDIVNALIDKGADVNAKGKDEKAPLHWAAENGYLGIVKALIKAGANVNIRGKGEETPLHWAAYTGHLEVVEALIDKGAEVDIADKNQRAPLHSATRNDHLWVIEALIDKGAEIDIADRDQRTPLHFAAVFNCTGTINVLINRGANINARSQDGDHPLHFATKSGCTEAVNALIDRGADINATDQDGNTPLYLAAEYGRTDTINALIDRGANINAKDESEWTPLHLAIMHNKVDVVNALIDRGADINAQDQERRTPLHLAAKYGHTDTINALIDRGANINARDRQGRTLLHLTNRVEIVNALIDRGADINAQDQERRTPLHLATIIAHGDVIEALIQRTLIQDFSIQRPDYLTDTFSTYWNRCLDEIKELEEENEPLYDFLRESNINNLVSIWERNENVCSRFDNQESLQEQYPEYAHILINKANEVKKEIFLHNHKPLIDVLSQLGYREGKIPDRIRAFLEENRDRFKVEFGNPNRSLIDFVSFEDVKARHVPELELRAVVSRVIGKNTPSRNLLNPNSEQHQAVGFLYS